MSTHQIQYRRLNVTAIVAGILVGGGLQVCWWFLNRFFLHMPEGLGTAVSRMFVVYLPSGLVSGFAATRSMSSHQDHSTVVTPALHGLMVGVALVLIQFGIVYIGSAHVPLFVFGYVTEGMLAIALSWTMALVGGRTRFGRRTQYPE